MTASISDCRIQLNKSLLFEIVFIAGWIPRLNYTFEKMKRTNAKYYSSSHLCVGVRECVVQESACMACKRSPVRFRYSPPLAQMRVTNTVDFKSKSTVFLCLSASKFIAILQILCKIKVEVHMDLVSAINIYPADKLIDNHFLCFKTGTIVQVCIAPTLNRRKAWNKHTSA